VRIDQLSCHYISRLPEHHYREGSGILASSFIHLTTAFNRVLTMAKAPTYRSKWPVYAKQWDKMAVKPDRIAYIRSGDAMTTVGTITRCR
jgi:hypothetical protein